MELLDFINLHEPALERAQVRHNLILGLLARERDRNDDAFRYWTLGEAGACAIKTPGRAIILGELTEPQCRQLAEETSELDYPGVVGPDETARQFRARAVALGLHFGGAIEQAILALSAPPVMPSASGKARRVTSEDADLFADWIAEFVREAAPHDPLPSVGQLRAKAGQGEHWFWTVDDKPVSLAGIVRRTRDAAAIAAVYTPPAHRNRGFAGAVVSTVAAEIFGEGRTAACLFTDLTNPASNRCYEKIGFKRVGYATTELRVAE